MSVDLARRVADYPFWYHQLDLGNGVRTEGVWDVGAIADRLPWPDVAGKRCLDIATFDGFYAFELERRGAREVVAVDISSWDQSDLSWDMRHELPWPKRLGPTWRHGGGFEIAREALGSAVDWRPINIYDLTPENVGTFDVITCGSLLLHLRDPIRALEAVRGVCDGVFMSVERVDPWLTFWCPRVPVAAFRGKGPESQWWNANSAGHAAWLESAGFTLLERSGFFVVPRTHGGQRRPGVRGYVRERLVRTLSRMPERGSLHRAALVRPSARYEGSGGAAESAL